MFMLRVGSVVHVLDFMLSVHSNLGVLDRRLRSLLGGH